MSAQRHQASDLDRKEFIRKSLEAIKRLREDPELWAQELEEREDLEGFLFDALPDEE